MIRRIFSANPTCLVVLLLIGLLTPGPSWGAEALNYRYTVDDENPLNYWFAEKGIRIDLKDGDQQFTIIYRSDRNSLNYLLHREKKAIVLNEAFLEKTIAQMEQMRRQLENLPDQQRKIIEKSSGEAVESLRKNQAITTPTLVENGRTRWKGRSAVRSTIVMDGDTTGTVLILEEPPLKFKPGEQSSVNQFQALMKKVFTVTGTMAKSLDDSQMNENQSFHLLGDQLFRLAVYRSTKNEIELSDWNRREVPENHFSIPEDFSVQKPGKSGGITGQ